MTEKDWSQMVPPEPMTFVARVDLGRVGSRTPGEVRDAISRSINELGMRGQGTRTPFNQQPGLMSEFIRDADGAVIGHWIIEGV